MLYFFLNPKIRKIKMPSDFFRNRGYINGAYKASQGESVYSL